MARSIGSLRTLLKKAPLRAFRIGDLQDIVRAVRARDASLRATEQPIDTSTALATGGADRESAVHPRSRSLCPGASAGDPRGRRRRGFDTLASAAKDRHVSAAPTALQRLRSYRQSIAPRTARGGAGIEGQRGVGRGLAGVRRVPSRRPVRRGRCNLDQRFLGSNHIRPRPQVCRTKYG